MSTAARRVWAGTAALASLLVAAGYAWYGVANDPTPDGPVRPVAILGYALFFGWAYMIAAPVVVAAALRVTTGTDGPARLLALATSGVSGRDDAWGTALRAELASIDDPHERRRFARGGVWTSLRFGWGVAPWAGAAVLGAFLASQVVTTSRADLAGDRSGSLWGILGLAGLLLPIVGFVAALAARSMRRGLQWGVAALAGVTVGILAAAIPEGAHYARVAGAYMLDGDGVGGPITPRMGALDALRMTFQWGFWSWVPWVVLGPAAGTWLRRWLTRRAPAEPAAAPAAARG